MSSHDSADKNVFSHSKAVQDLLRGFVHADWVAQLDYSTLEKVSGIYVTDDLRDRKDIIKLTQVQDETQPLQPLEERLNPGDAAIDRFILKGFDLLIAGDYFARYTERVKDYNAGKYNGKGGYDAFVQANLTDALATGFAVVTTAGLATKLLPLYNSAKAGLATLNATMEIGFISGTVFDALMQAGQVAVFDATKGASGKAEISTQQVLVSGGFGALLTPVLGRLLTGLESKVAGLFQRAPDLIDNLFATLGQITGRDASRAKAFGVPSAIQSKHGFELSGNWHRRHRRVTP